MANATRSDDLYPSRQSDETGIIARQDPVAYQHYADDCPLTREQYDAYNNNGYIVLRGLFSTDEVINFRRELDRLRTTDSFKSRGEWITEPGSNAVRSVFSVHSLSDVFARVCADERLSGIASWLLDDELYIHQSRVNYKPGFAGREFYWHSDFETWHVEDGMERMRALSMSLALTDNSAINGALMLIPGSHKFYLQCPGDTPRDHYKSSLRRQEYGVPTDDQLEQLVARRGIEVPVMEAGDVLVFDGNTVHGSNGNITPYPRSNLFFVYNAMSNRVQAPFCDQKPRPEWIASRRTIHAVRPPARAVRRDRGDNAA